jgi:hypothetical protein
MAMKRVHVLAAALPAVAALIPATAQAAAGSPAAAPPGGLAHRGKAVSLHPLTAQPLTSPLACSHDVCEQVFGDSDRVSKATESVNNTKKETDHVHLSASQYSSMGGLSFRGIWKSGTGSWNGVKTFTWHPACSWAGALLQPVFITAHASRHKSAHPTVSVWGFHNTPPHPCGVK